jgi:hypothetical protein
MPNVLSKEVVYKVKDLSPITWARAYEIFLASVLPLSLEKLHKRARAQ